VVETGDVAVVVSDEPVVPVPSPPDATLTVESDPPQPASETKPTIAKTDRRRFLAFYRHRARSLEPPGGRS
jgi:hypothetical protein